MIGRLQGKLLSKEGNQVLLDVNGVGYEVEVPLSTLIQLPVTGEVVFFTHFVVREDAQLLYGFYDLKERSLFRMLIKVNGVGPKMALAILSGMDAGQFAACVHHNDVAALVKMPGVGKKTAERLIIEMRDKLKEWELDNPIEAAGSGAGSISGSVNSVLNEAELALAGLGYKPVEASRAVVKAQKQLELEEKEINSSNLIRLALKSMA